MTKEYLHRTNQSSYTVRALSYVDMNKITLQELADILGMYPEWSGQFRKTFQITFNLSAVSWGTIGPFSLIMAIKIAKNGPFFIKNGAQNC